MLFHDVQERAALRNLAERDDETTEALEPFLLDHYATLHPHADYLMQIVKNVLAITGSYYFSLPRVKKMQFSEPHRQCVKVAFAMKIWGRDCRRWTPRNSNRGSPYSLPHWQN